MVPFFFDTFFQISEKKRAYILASIQLPGSLSEWRDALMPDDAPPYVKYWSKLDALFEHHGYSLFRRRDQANQTEAHRQFPAPGNYIYIPFNALRKMESLRDFCVGNGCLHAARKDNRHYVIRVMSVAEEGKNNLHILRLLSTTWPDNLYSNSHILPMVTEIAYHDIVFGVFPLAFGRLKEVINPLAGKSTIEDVVHLIMQALEAIIYIHSKNIAHRDLFSDNFLVDWAPQSMLGQNWTQPKVYLIDFETAVYFSDEVKPSDRLTCGLPVDGIIASNAYRRRRAPELLLSDSHMYCPFSLDIYQFGSDLVQFFSATGIEELDSLWPQLMAENPADRPTPSKVFEKLGDFINATPPKFLQRDYTCP